MKDRLLIRSITVRPAEDLPDYASWLGEKQAEGAQIISDGAYRIQGEDAEEMFL